MVNRLLRRGINVDRTDDMGHTALACAILKNQVLIVKALIDANACIDLRDHQGNTALMNALLVGNSVEIATLLLERGADVTVNNKTGDTVVDFW